MVTWLRTNTIAAGILAVLRIWLGYNWFTHGIDKFQNGFDASGYLKFAISAPVKGPDGNILYGWYVSFLENFALPNAKLFNFVIPWAETLIGLGLILGCLTTAAAFFALVMNFSFFFAGTVSTNPPTMLAAFILLFAGYNAGKFGLDRWVVPAMRKYFPWHKEESKV
ncbi:MAG: Crp/Fnr family transcriptional regulator [Bacillales bacterium]|jgi:thiosulfate dehydrogenase [quinone] large subunit|nr:Crp/Fnr family transcriptional regulator [Bacillales bacterium]